MNFITIQVFLHLTVRDDSMHYIWLLLKGISPIAGGTQVKWNRKDANILASSHLDEVLIWDRRVYIYQIFSI